MKAEREHPVAGSATGDEQAHAPDAGEGADSEEGEFASQSAEPRYKRPQSVLVIVHTFGGEVLLLRRTEPRDFWQSVTGSLRWGETPRGAAERELYEETGIRAQGALFACHRTHRFPIRPPWRERYAPNARFNLEHVFRLALPGRRLIRLNPSEHDAYRWLPHDRAARAVWSWTNRYEIEALRRAP